MSTSFYDITLLLLVIGIGLLSHGLVNRSKQTVADKDSNKTNLYEAYAGGGVLILALLCGISSYVTRRKT